MIGLTDVAARSLAAPFVTLAELTGPGDVLVLSPHPDDESLAMGSAIAAAAEAGHRVHVVVVTDGARSHPNSVSHPPGVLSALRRAEVDAAVSLLTGDASRPIWLGYPDMAAPESRSEFDAIARRLDPLMHRVSAIWTTWNGDPHPDHQRVWSLGRYCSESRPHIRLFSCPVWGRVQKPVSGVRSDGLRRFSSRRHRAVKARAVASHASQMTDLIQDDPDGFRMSADLATHFIEADEIFIPA